MIVSVGSIRGAPGVTSWSLLLAAAWPGDLAVERVMLEADPAGGVLGARYGFGVDPGAVGLVTRVRRNGTRGLPLDDIARQVEGGVLVVPGPESAERTRAVWADSAVEMAHRLALDARVWVVDVGRTDETNPSCAFFGDATFNLLVVGSRPEDLVQLPSRVESLGVGARGRVGVLVAGPCGFDRREVALFAGAEQAWIAPPSEDLIEEVGRVLAGRQGRRSWVWRRALDVAAEVADLAYGALRLEVGQ